MVIVCVHLFGFFFLKVCGLYNVIIFFPHLFIKIFYLFFFLATLVISLVLNEMKRERERDRERKLCVCVF